jgi:putative transposase
LDVSESAYYYRPITPTLEALEHDDLIRGAIDRWHTDMPYMGARKLVIKLREEGIKTNRKEVRRFMDEMGIYALYPRVNLSKRDKQHRVYPYLLRNKAIFLPNQVWAIDIY